MAVENLKNPITSLLALQNDIKENQGYFRSKLFISPLTNNSLVSAASPLFSLLERLCASPSLPAITDISENIEHELCAFQSRLGDKAHTDEVFILARFLLCATIDELLGKNYLRVYGVVTEFKAFTPLSQDKVEPQKRFFDIIKVIRERPHQYLDLIELAYYCLIAGFEGQQHGKPDGRLMLDNLIEELFQLIQKYRVNKVYKFFTAQEEIQTLTKSYRSVILGGLIGVGVLLFSLCLSHLIIKHKTNNIKISSLLTTHVVN